MTSHVGFQKGFSPEGYARELRHNLGIGSLPVNLQDTCERLGIRLKEDGLGTGVDGCLIRTGKKAGILVNRNIVYEARKRFTIAHEIGHHQIPWHDAEQYWSSSKAVEGFYSNDQHEQEANQFASEFLLPEAEATKILRSREISISLIKELADRFGMSLTAVALKLVKLCIDRAAVFYSVDSRIAWSVASPAMRDRYELRFGMLSRDTYAADFFLGRSIPDQVKPVGPTGWLSSGYSGMNEVFEHSICFPQLNAVLSLVTLPTQVGEDEEMDDEW